MFEGMQHRVMVRATANQMTSFVCMAARESDHGQVVRLRAAARENQFMWFYFEQRRQLIAGIVNRGPGLAPSLMHAGRISVVSLEVRLHRAPDRLSQRRRGVVIEVNHPDKISWAFSCECGHLCTT